MSAKDQKEVLGDSVFINPLSIEIIKNPRTYKNPGFKPENMERLRLGIQRDGLRHALLIRKNADGKNTYRLVAGERRLRCILELINRDRDAAKNNTERVLCKNPRTGKMEPALVVYGEYGVECKITDCADDREARRQAIQENTLAHGLTDYELLLQVREMEEDGFLRPEQADTLGVSEAHISQSHSLLASHPKLLEAMEKGHLTRTAAITFLSIPGEKVERVLDMAVRLTYEEAEEKEQLAMEERQEALKELESENDKLTVAQFTNNSEQAKKSRRQMTRAARTAQKAEKRAESARKAKGSKKITGEIIAAAAKEVDGAADGLRRPQSMKLIRSIFRDLGDLLLKEGNTLTNPETKDEYSKEQVKIVQDVLGWVLSENKVKHPLEVLSPIKTKKK